MPGSFPDSVNPGLFLSTTPMFDVGDLSNQENMKQLLIKLTQFSNDIAIILNQKDSAIYFLNQFVNGQTFFPDPALNSGTAQAPMPRQVFRQVFNFGALPNTATKTLAHNIAPTALFTFTRIYGASSDTTGFNYLPLPYASPTLVNNISLSVSATNIIVTTAADYSAWDTTYIILEWLKN